MDYAMNKYFLLAAFALAGCNAQSAPGPSVASISMISIQFQDAWDSCVMGSYQRALRLSGSKDDAVVTAFSDCKSQEDELLALDIENKISSAVWRHYKSQVKAKLKENGAVTMQGRF
jgi:hypothetical protein